MVALALTVPAPASAALVPQRSLAGIELGMTGKELRAAKGEPDDVRRFDHPIVGSATEWRYGLTRITVFKQSGVVNITTTSKRETYRGTGVGSTERAMRRVVRGERCATEFGHRTCHVGRLEPGRKVTTWYISRRTGKVRRISLGRVID